MCATLLASLPAGIRRIDVHVRRDSFHFDSEKLDAALAGLGCLESFRVVVEPSFSRAQREWIIEALPRAAKRGIVEVIVEGGDLRHL